MTAFSNKSTIGGILLGGAKMVGKILGFGGDGNDDVSTAGLSEDIFSFQG